MPRQRRQGQRGEQQKGQQESAGLPDQLQHSPRREPGKESAGPGRELPFGERRIEGGGGHIGDHRDGKGHQEGEAANEEPHPLHVKSRNSVEARQRQPETQERQSHRAGAQAPPEQRPQPAAQRTGGHGADQGEADENPDHQRRDRAQAPAVFRSHSTTVGMPADAMVIRRS